VNWFQERLRIDILGKLFVEDDFAMLLAELLACEKRLTACIEGGVPSNARTPSQACGLSIARRTTTTPISARRT
jgi:hypothetical protein